MIRMCTVSLHSALQAQPVIFDHCLGVAIIAVYPSLSISEFWGHRLCLDRSFQMPELSFHIHDTSAAYRTTIRALHVFPIATAMDAMATFHEYYGLRRCKHIFATDWTVTVSRTLYAAMSIPDRNGHADTASLRNG